MPACLCAEDCWCTRSVLSDLEGGETGCDHLAFGQDSAFGVLQLTLGEDSYSWELVATDGSVMDSGTAPTLGGGAAVS